MISMETYLFYFSTLHRKAFLRKSKPHDERHIEQNAITILGLLSDKLDARRYRVTANGRIVETKGEGLILLDSGVFH